MVGRHGAAWTRTALHLWFWSAYLMSTGTPGISAVQLQRQFGIKRYETAWMMLHKLRRSMVNPEREALVGPVEVDECFVGARSTAYAAAGNTASRPWSSSLWRSAGPGPDDCACRSSTTRPTRS